VAAPPRDTPTSIGNLKCCGAAVRAGGAAKPQSFPEHTPDSKTVFLQALLPKTNVGLVDARLRGLPHPGKIKNHTLGRGPLVNFLGDELRAVVHLIDRYFHLNEVLLCTWNCPVFKEQPNAGQQDS